jgi:hypothetical protein
VTLTLPGLESPLSASGLASFSKRPRSTSAKGQGRPAFFTSTLKVQRSAVGSGSGRPGHVWPMSQLGRPGPLTSRQPNGRNRRNLAVRPRSSEGQKSAPKATLACADLIRTRTAEGRSRANKRGQHTGRPPRRPESKRRLIAACDEVPSDGVGRKIGETARKAVPEAQWLH